MPFYFNVHPNTEGIEERKQLFQVCWQGDFEKLRSMIEEKPERVHFTFGKETLLHVAPTPEIAEYLLEKGIPIDIIVEKVAYIEDIS